MPTDADDHNACHVFPRERPARVGSAEALVPRRPPAVAVLSLDAEARISQKGSEALVLLLEAHCYARQLQRRRWEFAVEIACLRTAGLSNSGLRWLLGKGFLRHAYENTMPEDATRRFCKRVSPCFSERSCFVLTNDGVQFVERLLNLSVSARGSANAIVMPAARASYGSRPTPRWDPQRRELYLNDQLVKQFKAPASNQEIILAAFEEEQWPVRIDDPLPPRSELDPKRRLHATINSLNRKQKNALIRFLGDGTGEGLRWELVACQEPAASNHLEGLTDRGPTVTPLSGGESGPVPVPQGVP